MKRRLIETMEMQLVVPDHGHGIMFENQVAAWGGIPYAELSVILVHLRFLAFVHQTNHWVAKGDPFYGDHLLFERLYNAIVGEVDQVAEKSVGLGSDRNVNMTLQVKQLGQLISTYGTSSVIPSSADLAKKSMDVEVNFLRTMASAAESLRESGTMTRGLDNLMAGIEDVHEGHVYLLKQRSQGV